MLYENKIETKIEINITSFSDNYKQYIILLKTLLQNLESYLLESECKELELADVEADQIYIYIYIYIND